MKKSVFVLFSVLLLSCSPSTDEELVIAPVVVNTTIHPPDWIQGTWKLVFEGKVQGNGFTFYPNWFASFVPSMIGGFKNGYYKKIEETITDSQYNIRLYEGDINYIEFKFTRLSPTQIKWENPDKANVNLNVFIKQ